MLHTKFQGHWCFGSGEEDFLRFLPYIGMAAILVMWPGPFEQTFVPPSHADSIWNLVSISLVVSEEKMFEEYGRQTDGWWRPTYPISSSMSLWLRLAKNTLAQILKRWLALNQLHHERKLKTSENSSNFAHWMCQKIQSEAKIRYSDSIRAEIGKIYTLKMMNVS